MHVLNLRSGKYTSLGKKASLHKQSQKILFIHNHPWNVTQNCPLIFSKMRPFELHQAVELQTAIGRALDFLTGSAC